MYKWFLAWRYLHTKLIAFFGVASVMLCVAMVLVVMSVMGGFLDTVRERSRGMLSDVVLEAGSMQGFPYYEEFETYVAKHMSDIVAVTTPTIVNYGLIRVPDTSQTKPAQIVGVRLNEYCTINDFKGGLHYEEYFPGTTTLAKQPIAVAGLDPNTEKLSLPPELEAANRKWQESVGDPEEIEKYESLPYATSAFPKTAAPYYYDRVFAADIGEPKYEGPEHMGLIVGSDVLWDRDKQGGFKRYLARGTRLALTVLPLTPSGTLTGEPPVRIPLRYADDSRTGIFEIDSMCVYVDFDMLQQKLAMDAQEKIDGGFTKPRAKQLLIGLKEGVDLDEGWARVQAGWLNFLATLGPNVDDGDMTRLGFVDVYTWEDLQRPLIAAIEKEKVLVTILFGLISLVAIVLLGCIFYMIVEKKTKDIGILKSLGASGRGVAGLFVVYAAAIGVVGAALGTLLGSAFVWNINTIQDKLAQLNPALKVWSPDVYSFDKIPEVVKQQDAMWIAIVAVIASMVGSLIPAFLAARVWPVKALRYE